MRIYTDEAAMHGDETVVTTVIARARSCGLRGLEKVDVLTRAADQK